MTDSILKTTKKEYKKPSDKLIAGQKKKLRSMARHPSMPTKRPTKPV